MVTQREKEFLIKSYSNRLLNDLLTYDWARNSQKHSITVKPNQKPFRENRSRLSASPQMLIGKVMIRRMATLHQNATYSFLEPRMMLHTFFLVLSGMYGI
ncbi:hypothetical protein CDAR_432281 [Caerostris darwini]|uniref:Uncharacterized protein n=1 Tax=Caerostris darwini TaxID=1538125 RepID=A0AAV4U313_9ARAC|nr:hypothetical protein CDAR_432281 [Caerostris darwini]